MGIGLTFPLQRSTGSVGYFQSTNSELDAVGQNLRSLLLTNWGERVMHFRFGCNFREFLFEQLSPSQLRQRMTDRISSQVATWLPFVSIQEIKIASSSDDASVSSNTVKVFILFGLMNRPDIFNSLVVDVPFVRN